MAEQFIRDGREIFGVTAETVNFNSAMENLIASREQQCNHSIHGTIGGKKLQESFVFVPPFPDGIDHQGLVELSLQRVDDMGVFSSYNCDSMVGDLSFTFGQSQEFQLEQQQQYYNFGQVQELQLEQQQQMVENFQASGNIVNQPSDALLTDDTNNLMKQTGSTPDFFCSTILPYKVYDAVTRNFFVYYKDEYGTTKTNTYSAQRYGLSTAERLADKRLKELGVEIKSPETKSFSRLPTNSLSVAASTTPTITYDKKRRIFIVSWRDTTMYDMTKHFSAQRFGLSVAEELAKEFFESLYDTMTKVSNETIDGASTDQKIQEKIVQINKKKKVGSMTKRKYIHRHPKKSSGKLNTVVGHSESCSYIVEWTDEKGLVHQKNFSGITNDGTTELIARNYMDKLLLTSRAYGEIRLGMKVNAPTRLNCSRSCSTLLQEMTYNNYSSKLLEDTGIFHILAMKCCKRKAGYFTNRKVLVAKPTANRNLVNVKTLSKMKKVLSRQGTASSYSGKNSDECHGVMLAAAQSLSKNKFCKGRKKLMRNKGAQAIHQLEQQDEDDSTQPSTPDYEDNNSYSSLPFFVCSTSKWHISYTCNDSTVQIPIECIRRLAREGGITCLRYIIYRGRGGICFKHLYRAQ